MSRLASPIRRNDNVVVMTGKDRGKHGRVLRVVPDKNRVVVEGVNTIKRHTKPNPQRNIKGGVVEREAAVHASDRRDLVPYQEVQQTSALVVWRPKRAKD